MITKITSTASPRSTITSTATAAALLMLIGLLLGSGCATAPSASAPTRLSAALDGGAATAAAPAASYDVSDEEGARLFVVREHAPDALFLVADRTAFVGEWVLSDSQAPRAERVWVRRMLLDRDALAHLVEALPPDVALVQIGEGHQVHRDDLTAALHPLRFSVYPKSLQIGSPLF